MDRSHDRRNYADRDRDVGRGSYRPSDRSTRTPPRVDSYRRPRSPPPRRDRTPPAVADTYAPNRSNARNDYGGSTADRRRSRSPPQVRGREEDDYNRRPRSPMRHRSPLRDARPRSPSPPRRRSRSPPGRSMRDRSPPVRRSREGSPRVGYRPRSPIEAKRYNESTRDSYDRPARDPPGRFANENNYRPRPRSPSPARRSNPPTRVESNVSSRRSSPPVHPDRATTNLSSHGSPRRECTPPTVPQIPTGPRSPRSRPYERSNRSPPPRERLVPVREPSHNTSTPHVWTRDQIDTTPREPRQPSDPRPPPTGPASRPPPSPAPGPPSAPISMSAHNRPGSAVLSAPTRPRGGPGFARDDSREYAYRGGPSPRGGRGGFGGPPTRYDYPPSGPRGRGDFQSGPPSGPHDHHAPPLHHSYSASRGGSAQSHHAIPGFRPNNSSSGTYPRTQRFPQLASVPAIIEGGKKLPTMLDPGQEKRLQQLEEDKKKLMEAIEEKQRVKRMGLRDWERGEREIRREGLKSELAEQSLERLSGEGDGVVSGGGGAAY